VTSRAFASLVDFTALTRRHLNDAGFWMAMKGKSPADEVAQLPEEVDVFHVEQLAVPGLNADRCLVWMRPKR
jgi:16S rRNA (guanine527-N7)-methyltransferase